MWVNLEREALQASQSSCAAALAWLCAADAVALAQDSCRNACRPSGSEAQI